MSAYSLVDAGGRFLANVISKKGRNELQFYTLDSESIESSVKRHELQAESDIVAAAWINQHVERRAAKRKAENGHSPQKENGQKENGNGKENGKENGHKENGHKENGIWERTPSLAVAFASGGVWVFSPASDAVAKIPCQAMTSLAGSSMENQVWGLTQEGDLVRMHTDGTTTKNVKLANAAPGVTVLHPVSYKNKRSEDLLLAASTQLYLVDGDRKRPVVAEFKTDDKSGNDPIAYLAGDAAVVAAREHSSRVLRLDVSDPAAQPSTFRCSSSRVAGVQPLGSDYVVALTGKGAEIFGSQETSESGPVAVVRPVPRSVRLHRVFFGAEGLVGVWYDGVQPCFGLITTDTVLEGTYELVVPEKRESTEIMGPDTSFVPDITFTGGDTPEIANVSAQELVSRLSSIILKKHGSQTDALALCAANDNEDNIKDTVRRFSQLRQCGELVGKLFEMVARRVAQDPSRKTSLAVWLKWLLIVHGGYISKQPQLGDQLRKLQASLGDGMAMMGKLLALQGRLQLLKSQAELRTRVGAVAEEDESFNETFASAVEEPDATVAYEDGEAD